MKRAGVQFAALVVGAVLVVSGCRSPQSLAQPGEVGVGVAEQGFRLLPEEYPRVDGSTSAQPLGMFVACEMMGVEASRVYQVQRLGSFAPGSGRLPISKVVLPKAPQLGVDPMSPEALAVLGRAAYHSGTHDSYVNLIGPTDEGGAAEPRADLILVARLPSEDELNLAQERKIELDARPVALDAFVFIVNKANAVEDLTVVHIQDIYTGKITNWSQVGGKDEAIRAYQRDKNSGSQELMLSLVMTDRPMIDAPGMIVMGMMGPFNALDHDERGLGFTIFYYQQFMAPDMNVKLCAVDGVMPSSETIASRQYPFVTEVYAVIRKDLDPHSKAYQLRDWLLTAEGQAVVAKSAYVPIADSA